MTLLAAQSPRSPADIPAVRRGSATLPRWGWPDIEQIRRADPGERERSVEMLWPIVSDEAAHYGRLGGDREELEAEGALALWEGILTYDPRTHRTDPVRYLANRVHQRIRRAYRAERGYDRGDGILPFRDAVDDPGALSDPSAAEALEAVETEADLTASWERLPTGDRERLAPLLAGWHAGGQTAVRAPDPRGRQRLSRARRRLRALLSGQRA